MIQKKLVYLAVLAVALIVFSVTLASAVPQTINYQGVLTGPGGVPVNGTLSMDFAIYNAATGGTPLWSETQSSVTVTDGAFSVTLGSVTPIDLPFDEPYHLGVDVGGDGEMSPRSELVSVPYSMRAATVDTIPPHSHDAAPDSCNNIVSLDDPPTSTFYNACVSGGEADQEVAYIDDGTGTGHEVPEPLDRRRQEELVVSIPVEPEIHTNKFSISVEGFSPPDLAIAVVGIAGGDTTFVVAEEVAGPGDVMFWPGDYQTENLIIRLASDTQETYNVFEQFYQWWESIRSGGLDFKEVTIDILTDTGQPVYTYTFSECFPIIYRSQGADGYSEFELAVRYFMGGGSPVFSNWYYAQANRPSSGWQRVMSVCANPGCAYRTARYTDTFMTKFVFPDLSKGETNVPIYETFHFKPISVTYY